jgi:hypothetical protein
MQTPLHVARLSMASLALAAALSLGGCAGLEPKEPTTLSVAGEMKPERGLLTGEEGEWVIFRR